ncbi:hypothetical protein J6590_014607 [Homalodisca vitripennis]|nr:hypothetical protein J6590_014607 [Homalodisca vitripennis]
MLHDSEDCPDHAVFSDQSAFHFSGHVKTHNVSIRGSENPHEYATIALIYPKRSRIEAAVASITPEVLIKVGKNWAIDLMCAV